MINLQISVSDNVSTKERLGNSKPWFNGMHFFSFVELLLPFDYVDPID